MHNELENFAQIETAGSIEGMTEPLSTPVPRTPLQETWRRLRKDKFALLGASWLIFVTLVSLLAPMLAPYDPLEVNLRARLLPIGTPAHLLGTDDLGRDILSRLIWGGRISLIVGFTAVLFAMALGTFIGLLTGFYGGKLDAIVMRLIDILMAFPAILLAIAIVAALGPGLEHAMLAVAIVGIPYYTRIVRSSVLALREREYIIASQALGSNDWRMIAAHLFPNSLPPLIIAATLDVGWMIMFAAGLSFLGLGAQPPAAEWGIMLSEGHKFIRQAPHASIIPGLAIFLVVLSLNLLGDGLRDALDPRLRR
jgi:peptide/nickel transport system permease protein